MSNAVRGLIAALLALGLLLPAGAADITGQVVQATPAERAESQTKALAEALALDANQEKQLRAINLRYSEQIEALSDQGLDEQELFNRIQELLRAKSNETKALLTAEQLQRYQQREAESRELVRRVIEKREAQRTTP